MNDWIVFDTSVWVELFKGGPKTDAVKPYLKEHRVVPEITLAELAAKMHSSGRKDVLTTVQAIMTEFHVVGLNPWIADRAGLLRIQHKKQGLGINDALVWATAEYHHARLLTLDNDFKPFKDAVIL